MFVEGHMKNTMRKISEKERERIKEMTPMNDIMMQAMFEGNDRLVEYILRLLTGIKDLRVIKMDIQKVFKANLMYRSIRVDIYASDSKGREYNMEVQNDPDDANGDRARYYRKTAVKLPPFKVEDVRLKNECLNCYKSL